MRKESELTFYLKNTYKHTHTHTHTHTHIHKLDVILVMSVSLKQTVFSYLYRLAFYRYGNKGR